MRDILIFISDQHAWQQQAYAGDPVVRTPNLDRIAAQGTAMMCSYTGYPLCVPARMSMMTGRLPGRIGVMSNMTALDSNCPTFAHCLNAAGYETVLCGRMHFVGPDQRHGFSRRIAGEQTPIYHNRPTKALHQERGAHARTPMGGVFSLEAIGAGDSPTLAYDRHVVDTALSYLQEDHERPQMLCVGTYAPHHPYVAPRELYEYYYDKVTLPEASYALAEHPMLAGRIVRDTDPEVVRAVRAAYYGMVEFTDTQVGRVYDAFQARLKRTGREGVFIYVSDHGDHIGDRGYYGKSTFYEASAHIPMIFAGHGVAQGHRVYSPTSLMDLCPTLCGLAEAPIPPVQDGVSLISQLQQGQDDCRRVVISELGGYIERDGTCAPYGQMARSQEYKLIHYPGSEVPDVLYHLSRDPMEEHDLINEHPDIAEAMRQVLRAHCPSPQVIQAQAHAFAQNLQILMRCDYDSDERWRAPEQARHLPEHLVKSKLWN